MICPKCGEPEEQLDYWINNEGMWCWNCFQCGYEWKVSQKDMKEDIDDEIL